jgi:hypothetical protein
MSDQQQDRPDLSRRRRPQAAPDERVDPVDYRQSAPTPQPASVAAQAPEAAAGAAPRRGRPRREIAVPFSTRLAPDVLELIDAASAAEDGATIRSVVEAAIREKYQKKS